MLSEGASIENILYSSYVKYTRLSDITFNTFGGTSIAQATELNIFIDLYSMMHSIFSEHNRTIINDYTAITSCVVNMVAHYRGFFNNLNVKTKFFIIFSFNTCDINRKFFADYNSTFKRKSEIPVFAKIAKDNFELLSILCPYLPDVFFVKSIRNFESSVIISNIIDKYGNDKPNLIISKDLYPIQLCYLHPYTTFLKPIKHLGEDLSVMISISEKPSFRYDFWKVVCDVRRFDLSKFAYISPVNFPLIMALNKFPERDIKSTMNINKVLPLIYSIVGETDTKINPNQLYSCSLANDIAIANIISLTNVLDVTFMKPYYAADPESKSIKLENLRDDAAVNTINAKFFANCPLDLSRL